MAPIDHHRRGIDLDVLADKSYSAVFSDACDCLGRRGQTLDPADHSPDYARWGRLSGGSVAQFNVVDTVPERHYDAEIDFIDSLGAGDVVVATVRGTSAALWGELSQQRPAVEELGAVIDGLMRDRDRVEALGFPVHAAGTRPADSLGRVSLVDTARPVEVCGVWVSNGDLVVADDDGIVIVPGDVVGEAVTFALEKSTTERRALALLEAGALLVDAWNKFGVL